MTVDKRKSNVIGIESGSRLTDLCGGRAAIVPMDALEQPRLSIGARWFFALLCGRADRADRVQISQAALARSEGIGRDRLARWSGELQRAGLLITTTRQGSMAGYQVVRRPSERAVAVEEGARRRAARPRQLPLLPVDRIKRPAPEMRQVPAPKMRQENHVKRPPKGSSRAVNNGNSGDGNAKLNGTKQLPRGLGKEEKGGA